MFKETDIQREEEQIYEQNQEPADLDVLKLKNQSSSFIPSGSTKECEFNSLKQQRSQTVNNYVNFLTDFYDDFQFQSNCLAPYYPKIVQRHLQKRRNQNSEKIVHGLKAPKEGPNGGINAKALKKMKMLTKCQTNFM